MFIFSENIQAFVLKNEMAMKAILMKHNYSVLDAPKIVIFEDKSKWGYFNSDLNVIGLSNRLIYLANDTFVEDTLKHEIAHYLTFLKYGNKVQAHGPEYKGICHIIDADPSAKAKLNDVKGQDISDKSIKVVEKIQKLLKLADSSNPNEAELAMLKANQLLLKHNVNYVRESDEIYMQRVLSFKRKNDKYRTIYHILKTFNVYPVFSTNELGGCLEISGDKISVEIGTYVCEYLDRELDYLWEKVKKENNLKGLSAKNSFYRGLLKGYKSKIEKVNEELSPEESKSLVLIDQKNDVLVRKFIYKGLRTQKSTGKKHNAQASELGKNAGKKLSINKTLSNKSNIKLIE